MFLFTIADWLYCRFVAVVACDFVYCVGLVKVFNCL